MIGSGGEVLRVGIAGCGLATQSLHVPALQSLAGSYRITAVTVGQTLAVRVEDRRDALTRRH